MTGATQRLSLTKPEDTVSNGRHDDGQQHFHASSAVTAYFDRQGRLRSDITPASGAAFRSDCGAGFWLLLSKRAILHQQYLLMLLPKQSCPVPLATRR
jgi:hypothetical protein